MKNLNFRKLRILASDALTEVLAPSCRCLNCGRDVFDQQCFCPECAKRVVYNNGKTCKRCGVAVDGDEDYCGNCAFDTIYFDQA